MGAEALPALKWGPADEDGLVAFLVEEKSFSEDRVRKAAQRINASRSKSTQGESFAPRGFALGCPSCLCFGPSWLSDICGSPPRGMSAYI